MTCRFSIIAIVALAATVAFAGPSKKPDAPRLPEEKVVDQPPAENAENLIRNGGFEKPAEDGTHPAHWQQVDNLVFFWTTDPQAPDRGKVIKIDTDVYQKQAYQWWKDRFVHGRPLAEAPEKTPTSGPKFNTIGGLDGGFYWSEFIPVKYGRAYKVYVDAKGPGAKVFIRGYVKKVPLSFADEMASVQEQFRIARGEPLEDEHGRPIKRRMRYIYQTWFPVGGDKEWHTYTHNKPRHPTGREITEDVRFIRIELYPYWPAATYWFDNIRVIEVDPVRDVAKETAEEADFEEGKVVK